MTATEPSQPITDAELASIEARWSRYVSLRDPDSMETSVHDVPDLLAEVDRLLAKIADMRTVLINAHEAGSSLGRDVERLEAENAAARELHEPASEAGQGYDETGSYTYIEPCCRTCGTADEYAVRWPCNTAKALGLDQFGEGQANG